MHSEEKARCEEFGEYLVSHGTTVREAARYFGMSKSTVHKDVTTALKYKNPALAEEVAELLGISQSYISRLEKKIMKRLKREMMREI
mgnify:CR=1 FL=1